LDARPQVHEVARQSLLLQWQREQKISARLKLGTILVSLTTIGTLLTLLLVVGRSNMALVCMTLFSIYTRASVYFVHRAFLLPPFFDRLNDPDPVVREVALELCREHRAALRPLLVDNILPSDPESIAALADDRLSELAALADQTRWRAFGRKWLIVWCAIFATGLTTLIVTRGAETVAERVIN
jgi:hypothetical protein